MSGDLIKFAAEQQNRYEVGTLPRERRERGHFGTPARIAEFMSKMFWEIPPGRVRILDPGAGVGVLSAAVCERVLNEKETRHLEFELWESDAKLAPHIRETMENCRCALRGAGHRLDYTLCVDDFILSNARKTLFDDPRSALFDLAILNPPYYKLQKESPQAKAMEHVVHGQPNIYALFMAVAASLLRQGGEMVAISPRSYFNGAYFKRFRKWFLDRVAARSIHVFESRSDTFHESGVLQENVIFHGEKGGKEKKILLTASYGRDVENASGRHARYSDVIGVPGDRIIRVATNRTDHIIAAALDHLPNRLRDLGFDISTGRVVTFRSTRFLRRDRTQETAPLLWMHNVAPFTTMNSGKNGKPGHIAVTEDSMRVLIPAQRYVLLKRFTAKEERRRLVAGIVTASDSYSEWLGLENHLNYIHRSGNGLSKTEAFGVAAWLNSAIVDKYFRALSGNTQVNASEIRQLPMPDAELLAEIGKLVSQNEGANQSEVERAIAKLIGLSDQVIRSCGVAQ